MSPLLATAGSPTPTALTSGAGNSRAPAWSPTADRIVFESDRDAYQIHKHGYR